MFFFGCFKTPGYLINCSKKSNIASFYSLNSQGNDQVCLFQGALEKADSNVPKSGGGFLVSLSLFIDGCIKGKIKACKSFYHWQIGELEQYCFPPSSSLFLIFYKFQGKLLNRAYPSLTSI